MQFSERLIGLRKERGVTQIRAAREMGISNNALNNYERNVRLPDRVAAKKICDYYGVSYEFLFGEEKDNDEFSPAMKKAIAVLQKMSDPQIEKTIKVWQLINAFGLISELIEEDG